MTEATSPPDIAAENFDAKLSAVSPAGEISTMRQRLGGVGSFILGVPMPSLLPSEVGWNAA
jgi:hypothetical protein